MAIPNSAVWRVRAGGNNANGGGYDPSVSGVQSTTLNGAIASGDTTVVVASATGWPGSGNYYARIGNSWHSPESFSSGGTGSSEVVLVTGGQGTTSWTVTRGQLGTTAQAFASGVVVDNELSRCNTDIASGSAATSSASTTISGLSGANETWIGNVIFLASGSGVTVGPYFIQSITNSTTVVVDRASGTYSGVGVWRVGGAWQNPRTNIPGSSYILPGNIIYVRAGGSGSKASPDYTLAGAINFPAGNTTAGFVRMIGENGRPYIMAAASSRFVDGGVTPYRQWLENLYVINNGYTSDFIKFFGVICDVIVDQNGSNAWAINMSGFLVDSEVFSSVANGGAAGSNYAVQMLGDRISIFNCNIHDCWGHGVYLDYQSEIHGSIVAKNKGDGIVRGGFTGLDRPMVIANCTIDANGGHGISSSGGSTLAHTVIVGNIISNHAGSGKHGVSISSGTTADNDRLIQFFDYNTFYNNTSDSQNLTVSDSAVNGRVVSNNVGTNPNFVDQSTQNYAIGQSLAGLGFPRVAFRQSGSGQTTGVRSYVDPGAVQRQEVGSIVVNSRATAHGRR